jgi:hypothetical protein
MTKTTGPGSAAPIDVIQSNPMARRLVATPSASSRATAPTQSSRYARLLTPVDHGHIGAGDGPRERRPPSSGAPHRAPSHQRSAVGCSGSTYQPGGGMLAMSRESRERSRRTSSARPADGDIGESSSSHAKHAITTLVA